MKANNILQACNMPKSKYNISHASKLSKVYELLKELLPDILTAEIVEKDIPLMFGRHTETWINWSDQREERTLNEGNEVKADRFKVITCKGEYLFAIPAGNEFYNTVCSLLSIPYEVAVKPAGKSNAILVDSEVINAIKKAIRFTANDNLRPAAQCVCLDFDGLNLQVVSTDFYQLYYSEVFANFPDIQLKEQILIKPECFKAITALKLQPNTPCIIELFEDNTGQIEGIKFERELESNFPNYKMVIPDYDQSMIFDRKQMITSIKKVVKYANRSTNQVNFHLNGKIELSAEDIDFGFEGEAEMPYINKTFEDCDLHFNGNMMACVLNTFKADTIEMKHNGLKTKPGLFTDNKDTILLMPLMVNC